MSKPVRIEDAARNELRTIVAWYEDKQPGLGGEFFTEVDGIFQYGVKGYQPVRPPRIWVNRASCNLVAPRSRGL